MEKLLFGTAGIPHSSNERSTVAGIERLAELNLSCMEIEFVNGVHMGKATALEVAEVARRLHIGLTVHAPYYINLYSAEPEKVKASQYHILSSARIGSLCGADSVVFHTGFYGNDPPEKVYPLIKENLAEITRTLRKEDNRIWIRPEVMGKATQFGTIEEVIRLSQEIEGVLPAIDFSHWHARTGRYNSHEEFSEILKQIETGLGRIALDNMHIHVSGIKYGLKGEQKHLNLQESDFNYTDLIKALKEFKVKGYLICESPNLEEDAILLKQTFEST